jgi:hypothetical protein
MSNARRTGALCQRPDAALPAQAVLTAARRITAATYASPQSGQADIRDHELRSLPHEPQL